MLSLADCRPLLAVLAKGADSGMLDSSLAIVEQVAEG